MVLVPVRAGERAGVRGVGDVHSRMVSSLLPVASVLPVGLTPPN
jgi:hypothetical protein